MDKPDMIILGLATIGVGTMVGALAYHAFQDDDVRSASSSIASMAYSVFDTGDAPMNDSEQDNNNNTTSNEEGS
jgi:hypothetical protein